MQLEFNRLLNFVKSVQRQIDTLQDNGGVLTKPQLAIIALLIIFIMITDISDNIAVRVTFSIFFMILMVVILYTH